MNADVAQWQSNGFVNRRLRVRVPSSANLVFKNCTLIKHMVAPKMRQSCKIKLLRQSYGRHAHVAGTRKKLTNVKFFWGDKALNCRNLCFTPVGSAHAAKLRSSCPCGRDPKKVD